MDTEYIRLTKINKELDDKIELIEKAISKKIKDADGQKGLFESRLV
jgi:hypothetical protein